MTKETFFKIILLFCGFFILGCIFLYMKVFPKIIPFLYLIFILGLGIKLSSCEVKNQGIEMLGKKYNSILISLMAGISFGWFIYWKGFCGNGWDVFFSIAVSGVIFLVVLNALKME